MIRRARQSLIEGFLSRHPAVGLLGPRQSGKTTLAREIGKDRPSIYLDLENPYDAAKLDESGSYLAGHADKLVILDEIQRKPGLFQVLRGLIDAGRREGKEAGRFLLLGSASQDLLRQSSESLAGRIIYSELGPFDVAEIEHVPAARERLWQRGGFPKSYLAENDAASLEWRLAFIRTYLERDIPQLGPRIPAETLRRFWTMLAHQQGGLFNAAKLAASLGVGGATVARHLNLMVDLLLVRRLAPWSANAGKRLVKSPKVYVRDSGIVHALLGIRDGEELLGHPVAGGSWEGFVIESLAAAASAGTQLYFYRTAAGAEIDLVLELGGGRVWAIEIKRTLAPRPSRGFHHGCEDIQPKARFIVYPGSERYPVGEGIEAIGLLELARELE